MDMDTDMDMDGYGWIWMDMDGYGWIWMIYDDMDVELGVAMAVVVCSSCCWWL